MKTIMRKALFALTSNLPKKNHIPIIYYHDISELEGNGTDIISLQKLELHLKLLKELGYQTISFDDITPELLATESKQKKILITFDDGYISNYVLAFELFKKYEMKYNIFLEVGALGKKNYLTHEMIKEMSGSGYVCFGAHTYTHKDSRYLNTENIDLEILKSNEIIQSITNKKVEDFCFPYGAYSKYAITVALSTGRYKHIYTSDGRAHSSLAGGYLLGRMGILDCDSDDVFLKKVSGRYDYYQYIIKLCKRYLGLENYEHKRKLETSY